MEILDFISEERLKTFENHTNRQPKAIALHNHTLQLGSSLMSMIALLELSLRNSTNQQIIADYGNPEWLATGQQSLGLKPFEVKAIHSAIQYARKSAYAKLSYKEKVFLDAFAYPGGVPSNETHKKVVAKRQQLFVVSHGQIISQTTFSFWERLYSSDYESTLWKKSLKKVFPNKSLRRSDISKALEVIYATRNRVAHHEPVYGQKLSEAVAALDFIRNSLGAKSGEDNSNFKKFSTVQHLRVRMDYESYLEAWNTLTLD